MSGTIEKHPDARVAATAGFDIEDGSKLFLSPGCEIRAGARIEIRDAGIVSIGADAVVGANCFIEGSGDVFIGEGAILEAGAVLTSGRPQMDLALPIRRQPLAKRPIHIGSDVFIGANSTVLGGIRIAAQAVIRPNSLVDRDVEQARIVAGQPAEVAGHREATPIRLKLVFGIMQSPALTEFFVTMGNTLREAGVESWFVCNREAAAPLSRVRRDQGFVRDDPRDFGDILDRVRPDMVFIWGGSTDADMLTRRMAEERGIPCRFAEVGWFPQSETIYFDAQGTNARSSIRELDLDGLTIDPRLDDWLEQHHRVRAEPTPDRRGYILVPLQDVRDVNISKASPYETMDRFVSALATKFPEETFIVRPHPNFKHVHLAPYPNVEVRTDRSIHPWLAHADAVVGINSTALLESLTYDKPTHSVGIGLSTGLDVMYEFEGVDGLTIHRNVDSARRERTRKLLSELIFVRQTDRKALHYLDRLRRTHGISDLLSDAGAESNPGMRTASQPSAALLPRIAESESGRAQTDATLSRGAPR